jgi:hypothetical protein
MHTILIDKLRSYLVENNPDLLISLQGDYSVTRYLEDKVYQVMPLAEQLIAEDKPQYIIEELCLDELTKELRPSKFHYIKEILEEDFLQAYSRFREAGVLTYEVINLIEACQPTFDSIGFTEENENDRALKYAVMADIQEYLERG